MTNPDPEQETEPISSRRSKAGADQESVKRTQAWDLAARGVPQAHIARQLEVSERTVGRWLDAQRQAIVRHLQKSRHEHLVDNLAGLEAIGSEAWRRLARLEPDNDRSNSAQLLRLALSVMRDRVALEDRLVDGPGENEDARRRSW
jgi:predicted transcriptional regulator